MVVAMVLLKPDTTPTTYDDVYPIAIRSNCS